VEERKKRIRGEEAAVDDSASDALIAVERGGPGERIARKRKNEGSINSKFLNRIGEER